MRRTRRHQRRETAQLWSRVCVAVLLFAFLAFFRTTLPAHSIDSICNDCDLGGGGGPAPSEANQKLNLNNGVIGIAPGGGSDILELGNAGRDIASTGEIFFRPDSSNAGTKFSGTAGTNVQNLYVTGTVTAGTICVGSGANRCQTSWPPSGGSAYWDTKTEGAFTYLQPKSAGLGLMIGSDAAPVQGLSALSIYGHPASGAVAYFNTDYTEFGESPPSDAGGAYLPFPGRGDVTVNGRLDVNLAGFTLEDNSLYRMSLVNPGYGRQWDGYRVWSANNKSTASAFGFSLIDADTVPVNPATPLPFATDKNLFWKYWNESGTDWGALCLHTSESHLCTGGTNLGQPCTIDENCPGGGGGSCQLLCGSQQATCPANNPATTPGLYGYCGLITGDRWCQGGDNDRKDCTGNPGFCAPGGGTCEIKTWCKYGTNDHLGCFTNADCPGGTCADIITTGATYKPCRRDLGECTSGGSSNSYCYYGEETGAGNYGGPTSECQAVCDNSFKPNCVGTVAAGCAPSFGSSVPNDTGTEISDGAIGSEKRCDCTVSANKTYKNGVVGADLCSDPFYQLTPGERSNQ